MANYLVAEEAARKIADDHRRLKLLVTNLTRRLDAMSGMRIGSSAPPTILFKNESGETAPAFAVMAVTAGARGPFGNKFTIGKPSTTLYRFYLVNGPDPVPDDGTGFGTWLMDNAGGSVLYDETAPAGTPVFGRSYGPKDGEWKLFVNRPGFLVLGADYGTGTTKIMSAKQYVVQQLLVKADSDIAKGAAGTCSVYWGLAGSEADTGMNITARALGAAVTASKWATAAILSSDWYVAPWECT